MIFLKNTLKTIVLFFLIALCYPVGYFVLEKNPDIEIPENSRKKSGVITYVINLDRSKGRYEYVKDNLHALGYPVERISAVDAKAMSDEEIKSYLDLEFITKRTDHNFFKGAVGCALSHIKVWQAFLESDAEYALIFEDDVVFDPKLLKESVSELLENKEKWDIVQLYIDQKRGMPLHFQELGNQQKMEVYLTKVYGTVSYLVNRKAARALLEKSLPLKMPIDVYFTRSWESDLKFIGVGSPYLVGHSYGNTNIENTNHIYQLSQRFDHKIYRELYKAQTFIIRLYWNLKLYLTLRFFGE